MQNSHSLQHAREIFLAGVAAVQPQQLIPQYISWNDGLYINNEHVPLRGRLIVAGAGKASAAMAQETEKILGAHISEGLVVTKHGHALPLQTIRLLEAGHPLPDEQSVVAGTEMTGMLSGLTEDDVVIFLLSGGASALLADYPAGSSLEALQQLFDQLIRSGATIHEINTVRKHLSAIKGGGLAKTIYPARLYSLILSDVVGDQLEVIGSGPTAPDTTTITDALAVLARYGLQSQCPLTATPKPGDPVFDHCHNIIIGSNAIALEAAVQKATALGYHPQIISSTVTGSVYALSGDLVQRAIDYKGPLPACLLMGGESTITVKGSGLGGRNQQFALYAGTKLSPHITILSGGTDGTDGPTDAAGAIVNTSVMANGKNADAYLQNNDAYHFFEGTGALLLTGPTQTNVMDIMLALVAHS